MLVISNFLFVSVCEIVILALGKRLDCRIRRGMDRGSLLVGAGSGCSSDVGDFLLVLRFAFGGRSIGTAGSKTLDRRAASGHVARSFLLGKFFSKLIQVALLVRFGFYEERNVGDCCSNKQRNENVAALVCSRSQCSACSLFPGLNGIVQTVDDGSLLQ